MAKFIDYGDECPICKLDSEDCKCDPALIVKLRSLKDDSGKIRKRRKEEG